MMDYFYGNQVKQFTSIEIPKELLTGNRFSVLSPSSKMLYAIMLDRMKQASGNKWIDEERRIYNPVSIKSDSERYQVFKAYHNRMFGRAGRYRTHIKDTDQRKGQQDICQKFQ